MYKKNTIVPPINSKGRFKFKEPFNQVLYENQIYTVVAIRNIHELISANLDPLVNIYNRMNLSIADMQEDMNNKIPIVILKSTGNEFINIPASYILSEPINNGLIYVETLLAINLGKLPKDYDIELLGSYIKDCVYDVTGITSEAKKVYASAEILIDDDEHRKYKQLLDNKKNVDKSYRTRYYELSKMYDDTKNMLDELEKIVQSDISSYEKKIKELEDRIKELEKENEDKDKLIKELEDRIKVLEDRILELEELICPCMKP